MRDLLPGLDIQLTRDENLIFLEFLLRGCQFHSLLHGLVDPRSLFGGGVKPLHVPVCLRKTLYVFGVNRPVWPVTFVSNYDKREVFRVVDPALVDKLFFPRLQLFERGLAGEVIYKHTCVAAPVESRPDGLELFLTCSVPDLVIFTWRE